MSCVPRRPSITFITDRDSGIVWNAFSTSGAFTIPGSSQPASFIFATLDGLIVGCELRRYGIELIAPHRMNRKNTTQDLRRLRRYRRRWKIERLFAWLQNLRRLVVRYERYAENFLGMLHLGCCLILLRHL